MYPEKLLLAAIFTPAPPARMKHPVSALLARRSVCRALSTAMNQ